MWQGVPHVNDKIELPDFQSADGCCVYVEGSSNNNLWPDGDRLLVKGRVGAVMIQLKG